MILHRVFLFAHVLFAFLYLLAHGTSMAVAFRVRRESSPQRVRALLELSKSTVGVSNILLLATITCGVVLGFLGHWWSTRWIWLSIAVLVIVFAVMGRFAAPYFRGIRNAVGKASLDRSDDGASQEPAPGELARALAAGNPAIITWSAIGGWAVILWLMLFKPF